MGTISEVHKEILAAVPSPEIHQPELLQAESRKDAQPDSRHALHSEMLAADTSVTLSLIDLAEILDQHKTWVESGGESGVKADLCGVNLSKADLTGVNLQGAHLQKANLAGADLSMANLRGASLVQADLREANLLGTELRGANLMGATVYGAEGLWLGRLGGANLFDALLPESIAAVDSAQAIGDATKIARFFYFLTNAVCAICVLLIAFTSDGRLLMNASAFPIRFGNILPMTGFYMGAPILLAILYIRFHFLLLRLWGSMAALPAVFPDGQTLEREGPWYLMGLVRRHFRWQRDNRSPFAVFETVLSTLIAYWVVPATLFLFWLRYLVCQDFRGTLLQLVLLTLSIAAATSLPLVVGRVLRPGDLRQALNKNSFKLALKTMRPAIIAGCILLVLSIGIIKGLPADSNVAPEQSAASPRRWAAQLFQSVGYRPYADMNEAVLSTPPRGKWTEDTLAEIPGAHLNQIDLRFARAYHAFLVNAHMWRADLEGAYLSEADLRGANLRESLLKSAILDRAKADHVVLVSSDGTGANLASADLQNADLSYATFQNATFSGAKLSGASLYAVDLRGARMLRTDLTHADLRDTKLAGAILSFADLQGADLSSAQLEGASLTGALLKSTILLDADMKNADLRGVTLADTIVRGADFTGANLAGADLRGAIGLSAAQICSARWSSATMEPEVAAAVQAQCPK